MGKAFCGFTRPSRRGFSGIGPAGKGARVANAYRRFGSVCVGRQRRKDTRNLPIQYALGNSTLSVRFSGPIGVGGTTGRDWTGCLCLGVDRHETEEQVGF